jgi:hypothetical protein
MMAACRERVPIRLGGDFCGEFSSTIPVIGTIQNDSGLPQGPNVRHTGTLLMRQTACARRP